MKLQELKKAYNGKKVYITGITGFKGSWLAFMLKELGADVYGIGLDPDTDDTIFDLGRVSEIAKVTIGDITDPANESAFVKDVMCIHPDYIFHLAAQPLVSLGYKDPYNTFRTNIMGTVILHELLRGLDPKLKRISLVNVTTDKVYKESKGAVSEGDELRGFDPYSLSKSCADMISTCYREVYGGHYISTVRAGNVIGGGDMAANRIIPDAIRAIMNNEVLEIRSPESVRPYQHVFDALSAYLLVGMLQVQDETQQGEWNVGPDLDQVMNTRQLLGYLQNHTTLEYSETGKSIGHENEYLALANDKIKAAGWSSAFEDNNHVLGFTAEWYNEYIKGSDMLAYTQKQVKEAFAKYE